MYALYYQWICKMQKQCDFFSVKKECVYYWNIRNKTVTVLDQSGNGQIPNLKSSVIQSALL